MKDFANWNAQFESAFLNIPLKQQNKPSAFLSVIPEKQEWSDFVDFVRQEWRFNRIFEYPYCLVTLYAGIAFFEYESGDFWKPFAKNVGKDKFLISDQNNLNDFFLHSIQEIKLEFLKHKNGNDFVGTAIFQIGVPLSYWDDFLKICENLWWKENWQNFTEQEWKDFINRKTGGLQRLKRFLTDYPNTARRFIKEVHDVRELISSCEIPVEEILSISFLRPEHFEESPETAEFLSPLNPEKILESKLFKNQFRLVFNESAAAINLYLPPVKQEKLPAVWKLNELETDADLYQQEIGINTHAFQPKISFCLESENKTEKRKINGIDNWALFDGESGYRINEERQSLSVKSYTILSLERLENLKIKGFDDDEYLINQPFLLNDGSNVFITKLVPLEQKAKISFDCEDSKAKLKFQSKGKVNIYLLSGRNEEAMQFRLFENTLKTNHLPVPCLTLPLDLFDKNEVDLSKQFKVSLNEQEVSGKWDKIKADNYNEIYVWEWNEETKVRKKLNLNIECEGLGIKKEFKIEILQPKDNLAKCWNNFPDKYLPFILLAQPNFISDKGTTFDEMREIKEIITPTQRFVSLSFFHFYEKYGILKGFGNRWQFAKSKLYLGENETGNFLRFCGNPCVFWQIIRFLSDKFPAFDFSSVEIVSKKGELTHLFLILTNEQKEICEKYANDYEQKYGIALVNESWEEIKWIR